MSKHKHGTGVESRREPTSQNASDVEALSEDEAKLVAALRAFIKNANAEKPKTNRVELWDVIWLIVTVACVMLALSFVPETWFKGEASKLFIDKVLPWCLNFAAIAAILKKPESLLAVIRPSSFRWSIFIVFVLLVATTYPAFEVEPQNIGDSRLFVDDVEKLPKFSVNFRTHEVELRPKSQTDTIAGRHFQIRPGDLLSGLHIAPDWRLLYTLSMQIDGDEISVCFEPKGFEFDRDFVKDPQKKFRRIGSRAAEYLQEHDGGADIQLPMGDYRISGHQGGCTSVLSAVAVGPTGQPVEVLPPKCSSPDKVSPCDQLLPSKS